MPRSLLDSPDYRLQFAGHETFPLRYGWLKKAYDAVYRAYSEDNTAGAAVFNDDLAIARFGVGKNMVLSIRHWALATEVLTGTDIPGARSSRLSPGPVGQLLFDPEGDPYLEHPASIWLLHWMLARRPGRAAAWHWAFNEFHEPSFDRELMTRRLRRRCENLKEIGRLPREREIAEVTLRRDVECLVRTYFAATATGRKAPEDSIESPLAELGLIQRAGVGDTFQFRRGPKPTLADEVFLFALADFWEALYPSRRSFSIDFLTFERGSPGQVFLMDEDSIAERLLRLEQLTDGALRWDESAGMRQIYAPGLQNLNPWETLRQMYRRDKQGLAA
jgi:hypothetical protein